MAPVSSRKPTRILVCDDERNMRNLLVDVLEDDGWQVVACENGREALDVLRGGEFDVPAMVLDLTMPEVDGFRVIEETRRLGLDTSIIVITAYGTVETAVRAMRTGASDFLVKPFENAVLKATLRRAMESRDLLKQLELSHPTFLGADLTPLPIIGQDTRLRNIFKTVRKIADLKTSVLVTGESGTGKELVAQAIHFNGSRRAKPFVAVNCGALPESLLESEFFGHERGAFTGAHALQRGKFELADGGTLFLDEIGEMPLALQVKLLRVLQDGRFTRVGGEKEIEVDVRVIAATNRDLATEVPARTFREDLYYRLNVIPIHLPPLRERLDDIPQLVKYFADRFCQRHNLPPLEVGEDILETMRQHTWPGNIRELQNVVEKAVILQEPELLKVPMRVPPPAAEAFVQTLPAPAAEERTPELPTLPETRHAAVSDDELVLDLGRGGAIRELAAVAAEAQRGAVIRALRLCNGNKAEAAKRLGVSYKTLFNRIHELGIEISTKVE
jgi:DNA-binding NtrC family response regulator